VVAGRSSILIAETSDTVTALNNRARADQVLAGQVALEDINLRDGTIAGQGDTIVTRNNDRHLTTGRGWAGVANARASCDPFGRSPDEIDVSTVIALPGIDRGQRAGDGLLEGVGERGLERRGGE
jgi:hypothetical protein